MNVHLIVPDLFWPAPDSAAVSAGIALEALELLLARGRRSPGEASGLESWLCRQFGVARQTDWPAAPYSLVADGGEPGSDTWLRADPCHLRVATDQLLLADSTTFALTREEAEALVETLNRHFAADGLTFYPMRAERWYVRLATAPSVRTTPIGEARGRSIDPCLPAGDDEKAWHARLNEVQMLLHTHPVNDAREARGLPAVNSVWLWGGGTLAATIKRPFPRMRASDPLAIGLAQAAGSAVMPTPAHAQAWLEESGAAGVDAILLDSLRVPAAYGDAEGWRTQLAALERHWFMPLAAALRAGRIGMLTLRAVGPGGTLDVETTRQDLRYLWRRARPLASWRP